MSTKRFNQHNMFWQKRQINIMRFKRHEDTDTSTETLVKGESTE